MLGFHGVLSVAKTSATRRSSSSFRSATIRSTPWRSRSKVRVAARLFSAVSSAEIAAAMGPFPRYRMNRKPFLEVIGMHRTAALAIPDAGVPEDLLPIVKINRAEFTPATYNTPSLVDSLVPGWKNVPTW